MKTETYVKLAGDAGQLGRLFDPPITRQAVRQWGDVVPPLRVYQLREIMPEWFDEEWLKEYRRKQRKKKESKASKGKP